MLLYLAHHGDAVGPDVDPQRPLSERGRRDVARLAADAATRGVRPALVWHSGKLRARQTAMEYWRACNALAEFSATRDLQPQDSPEWIRDRLLGETRDVLIAGHFFHLPRLLSLLTEDRSADFPQHGFVALERDEEGRHWHERWRLLGG